MEIRRIRPSSTEILELTDKLRLGDGLGLRQNAQGLVELVSGSWVEVKADSRAKVDDSTDDTTELNQIVTYLNGLGGGVLLHRNGTIRAADVKLKSNVLITGSSRQAAIFKLKNSAHTTFSSGTSTGSNATFTFNHTGAAWPTTGYGLKGKTLQITGGTGSGQKRLIASNTSSQIVPDVGWTTIPDSSSTYNILTPLPLFSLFDTAVEFSGITHATLLGNKANQTAYVDGIQLINTAGGATLNPDEHHLFRDLLIKDFTGNGWTKGRTARESRVINVVVFTCDEYGFNNFTDLAGFGGSDSRFTDCTTAQCGKSGVYAEGNDQYSNCKSFGNGLRNISGNGAGFAVWGLGNRFASCDAQENWEHGWKIGSVSAIFAACGSDANQGSGVQLVGALDNNIQMVVSSTPGLLYQTQSALSLLSGSDRNTIFMNAVSSHLSGGLLAAGFVYNPDNFVLINNRLIGGRLDQVGSALGAADEEKYKVGKEGSPATNNPYYVWKLGSEATNPKYRIEGWNGTTTKKFIELDYGASKVILGHASVVSVEFAGTVTFASGLSVTGARIDNLWGTDAASTNEHFVWGKTGGGASGNPYYLLKTDASAQAISTLQSNDGSTIKTYLTFDHANSKVVLGQTSAVSVEFAGTVAFTTGLHISGGRVSNFWGTDGGSDNEHFVFGKTSAGASGNPYYAFKTDSASQAMAIFEGWDNSTAVRFFAADYATGVFTLSAPNSWGSDGLLVNSQISFYLDQSNHKLKVRVRYSDGTLKTGEVSLV